MTPPPEDPVIGLRQVAAELGQHYDTVRKHWREWAGLDEGAFLGFPFPCRYPEPGKRGVLGWRAAAVAEWKFARERALGLGRAAAPSAPQGRPAAQPYLLRNTRIATERTQLQQLLERA